MMNVITKNVAVKYLREAREELKKVTWPSRQETLRYTLAIVLMSALLGVYFGLLDWALTKGLAALVSFTS